MRLLYVITIAYFAPPVLAFGPAFVSRSNRAGLAIFSGPPSTEHDVMAVSAPLKFIGPYPCLALRFPNLGTSAQRSRNETGVSLDFVVDTAANTNTIQGPVVAELQLKSTGQFALPGVSATGSIPGGETFLLGDTQLDGMGPDLFMIDLTASVLPVSNPAAAGVLSLAFLQCFPGGVEFDWENRQFRFLSETNASEKEGLQMIPIERQPITQLPLIQITINNVELTALLDTGSPITIIHPDAAKRANIDVQNVEANKSRNPFKSLFSQNDSQVLTIMGGDGKPTKLYPTKSAVEISMFGESVVYVGQVPGLAALQVKSPDVILGTDVLKRRPKMILRVQQNEMWI
ncbi:hypothetical protein FisN_2Lu453 [Fistulifera solaris]|uniref:Peptidase A2 domain-containing protein n=1 Tax=Fistulifera solaris TaxID=1519565 RepID=A0A1Z5JAA1_FISSO|nr:hypothetical protein FisN_2Lu453 [Fistulifera solaris]|eukprot:GAX10923.1 hypothetical protein FisN_2Lu453 [Fistulifera solaris]